jgi:hypothetical protein
MAWPTSARFRGLRRARAQAEFVAVKPDLLLREVLPFFLRLAALLLATLLADALLHLINAVWIGRYLGIPGVLLILASFGHSLRKRGVLKSGNPVRLLHLHEWLAWAGSLLVLVHAGIHFNAVLAWLAVVAMLINITSGLTGKYLLRRAQTRLKAARAELKAEGVSDLEASGRLHRDSLTVDVMRTWRKVHLPIALVFAVLALAHIVAIFVLWGWQ